MSTDSQTQFKLPGIGEGVESADVAEILVEVGDEVTEGQILMELETEKAVVELPAPAAGTVSAIHIAAGDTIEIGQHIMDFGGGGEAAPAADQKPDTDPQRPTDDKPAAKRSQEQKSEPSKPAAKPDAPSGNGSNGSAGGSVVDFQTPGLGEGVESADVAEIMISPGDTVSEGQIIMEVETEKAVVEMPISVAGEIAEVLVSEGDTIEIGQVIVRVKSGSGADGGSSSSDADPNLGAAQPADASEAGRSVETDREQRVPEVSRAMAKSDATAGQQSPRSNMTTGSSNSSSSNGQASAGSGSESNGQASDELPAPAAPSTRRLARQLGVNLRSVQGSGPGGRITRDDIQSHVKDRLTQQTSSLPAKSSGGSGGGSMALAPPPLPDFTAFGEVEREKMGKLSRTAAENLTTAWHVIPHVTQQDLADITDIEASRKAFAKGPGQNGPKVTMTAIAMKTLATCLQAFPKFNSSLDPETFELVYKRYYHIGCAVDTPNGLLVPVIRDCDQKSILEIAAELTDLAGKARDRKLSPDSMRGATCTVTNLGGIGGTGFTPIVNYPEVAILGMSRGEKRLAMQAGQVVERLLLPLSLSYDHRVINGADAAKFLVMFKNMLADPFSLLAAV